MNQEKFDQIVKLFESAKDEQNKPLQMHYLLIHQENQEFLHRFDNRQIPSDVRSISKTVLALTTGILIEQSTHNILRPFTLETKVWPILKNVVRHRNKDNLLFLEQLKIKHLLNHMVGYKEILLMRDDIKDMDPYMYLDYIINHPIKVEPGTHYLYSNASYYLLTATLQEFLKMDVLDFIDINLFKPIGITDYKWERYGNYIAGATRLWLYPHDLLKLGQLIMNDGRVNSEPLVSKEWIDYMRQWSAFSPDVDEPSNTMFRRYSYANGLWLSEVGFSFGYGTDGQTMIMLPEKETIIITIAHQVDVKRLEEILDQVIQDL